MSWYKIVNKTDKAEVWIYEMIGEDFWTGGGVTAKDFQKEISSINSEQIDLHINSPGGDVFDGIAIYNLLKQHKANITTYIDGLAASIASVIAMAGNEIYIAENALFMLHNPLMCTCGNEEDHLKSIELLNTVKGSISKAYINKTNKKEDEIFDMMNDETWLGADDAVEYGFADDIIDKIDIAACAKFYPVMNNAGFKKIPQVLNDIELTIKDAEKALRDAGFSRKNAKTIVAKGFTGGLRDADQEVDSISDNQLRDAGNGNKRVKDRTKELLKRADLMLPTRRN